MWLPMHCVIRVGYIYYCRIVPYIIIQRKMPFAQYVTLSYARLTYVLCLLLSCTELSPKLLSPLSSQQVLGVESG